ncbi:unnamed protein product [Parascedosporium putredinis]|uniref:Peptidase A1 domain-containing protein n=1 Tax=Parascedosporium putredinis TaxID=1442378 RepID=A0A9P1GVE8_9PEZI|nr:unnamed protein product [Parascedosporium putredinis]CAI7988068.1 unnamed protein product [Parascedosporium putredinis]
MARLKLSAALAALCGTLALGATLPTTRTLATSNEDASIPKGMLAFPMKREPHDETVERRRVRRAEDTDTQIYNYSSVAYMIELDLGTPAQTVKVIVDTGSSELWVNPDCDTASSLPQQSECLANDYFNVEKSSTIVVSNRGKTLRYGLGDATIRYVTDNVGLPGSDVELETVRFGVAQRTDQMSHGILGLSFGNGLNLDYNNFVDELFEQNGLLTFGGLDTKKYSGKLHTEQILGPQNQEDLYRFWVTLNKIGLTDGGGNSKTYLDEDLAVFFDTGATLSYLPEAVVTALAKDLDAEYRSDYDLYLVPCGQDGSVDFTFGNTTINVSLHEFIWELRDGTCAMGAMVEQSGSYILGASFLRSVYAVFDLQSPAIHFAAYANCGSNLQEVPAGTNAAAHDDDSAADRTMMFHNGMWLSVGLVAAEQALAWLL